MLFGGLYRDVSLVVKNRLHTTFPQEARIVAMDRSTARPSSIPDDADARPAIPALVEVQARLGGDALIGRRLYPLLCETGFSDVHVSPRLVYADASRPDMVSGFTEKTFTADGRRGR